MTRHHVTFTDTERATMTALPGIATSSVKDGLDFACQLLQVDVSERGRVRPDEAAPLLGGLCFYIELRYVGEYGLALEALERLATEVEPREPVREQFWAQMRWVAAQFSNKERSGLRLPLSARDIRER